MAQGTLLNQCSVGPEQEGNLKTSRYLYVCECAQLCPTLCNPMDYSFPGPQYMEFSRHKYYSGFSFPPLGDLPHPGRETQSLVSPALAGRFFPPEPPGSPRVYVLV